MPVPPATRPIAAILTLLAALWLASARAAPEPGTTFKDWIVGCESLPEGGEPVCHIYQTLSLKEQEQQILHVAVGYLPGSDKALAVFTMPLGIALPPGVQLQVDEAKPLRFPVEYCDPNGCRAGIGLDDKLLAQFRKGLSAKVTFADRQHRGITVPVSLSGFTAGFAALESGGAGEGP
jgi:invasion protein IalB